VPGTITLNDDDYDDDDDDDDHLLNGFTFLLVLILWDGWQCHDCHYHLALLFQAPRGLDGFPQLQSFTPFALPDANPTAIGTLQLPSSLA
jgi:hypothetical protein